MSTDMARLGFDVDTRGLRGARSELRSFGSQASTTSRRVTPLIRAMLPVASVAGFAFELRNTIRTFAEYQQSMARVQAISRATDNEFKQMNATAKTLGATTEFTAAQAASGFQFLAQAGFSASDSIAALPSVLNLATAASLDLGRSADITSNVMSGFGIAATEAGKVADVLAAASSRANTDVGQLGDAMSFVGPVAAGLGIEMSDTAAAIGVLSDAGIQGSSAGTGLRRVLSSLANPTEEARSRLQAMGVTLDDVNPQTNELSTIIDTLSGVGLEAADALKIFGDRGGPAILALTSNNERVAQLTTELRNVDGEADRMAGTMRDTLTGDMQALGSAVDGVRIAVGERLNPAFRASIQGMTNVARALGNFASISDDAAEKTRLLQEAMRESGVEIKEDYIPTIDDAVEAVRRLIEGKSMLDEVMGNSGNTITGNTQLMRRLNVTFGAGARQQQRFNQIVGDNNSLLGMMQEGIDFTARSTVDLNQVTKDFTRQLQVTQRATDDQTDALEEQSIATYDLEVDTRSLAEAKNHASHRVYEMIQSLENEIMALDMTSREQAIFNAELRALSAGAGPEAIATIRRLTGEHYDMAEAQRHSQEAAEVAARETAESWRRTHSALSDTFVDIANNGRSAFQRIGDSFKAMITRMVAEWAASGLMSLFGIGQGSGMTATDLVGSLLGGGGGAGGVAGNVASLGGLASSAGGFISGATGSATGIAAGTVGPPTAAASAGAGFMSSLPSLGTLGMVGAGLGAAALIANRLDSGGTMSSNAGLLVGPAPGIPDDRRFSINSFASGFQGEGFARRTDHNEAQRIIQGFAEVDTMITRAIRAAGGQIDMSGATLGGFDEKGQGSGVFLGTAAEEGSGVSSAPMEEQLNKYARQVAAHAHGLGSETQQMLTQARSLDEIMSILGVDGSHRTGLDFVPRDGYRAELHAGERVQTARAARDSDNVANEIRAMRADYRNIMKSQIKATMQIAKLLDDWDVVGQPETRTV